MTKPPGAPPDVERVRRLIERGLDRYARGHLQEARLAWLEALELDPRNTEASNLVAFIEQQFLAEGHDPGQATPATDEGGRAGWSLAAEPAKRPLAEPDTPVPTPGASQPSKTMFAWGGRGRVAPMAAEEADAELTPPENGTDPAPQPSQAAPDELDWSDVNPPEPPSAPGTNPDPPLPPDDEPTAESPPAADVPAAESPLTAEDFRTPPPLRSRRATVESPISALIAASMPEEAPDVDPFAPEPATPRVTPHDDETRRLRVAGAPISEPPSGPSSVETAGLGVSDLATDAGEAARKRAAELVDRARADFDEGNVEAAAEAAEFALTEGERAPPPGIAEVIEPARPLFARIFEAHVGPSSGVPTVTLSGHEIAAMTFDHRTGFMLSRIDGTLAVDDILDVSGMSAFESFRILSSLLRAGIISVS